MFKKIAIGALIVALAGGLVAGAVYRTSSKTATSTGNEPAQRGHGAGVEPADMSVERNGSADRQDAAASQGRGSQGAGNGGSQGEAGNVDGQRINSAEDNSYEWTTLSGTATSVDAAALTIARLDGEELIIDGRDWQYAQEQGFWTEPGHSIVVNGFYDDGAVFVAAELYDMSSQTGVTMREDSGRPMWSGGYGNGRSQGTE